MISSKQLYKTQFNEELSQIFTLMERIDPSYRQTLNEADDRIKRVSKMLDVKFNGLPLDEPVTDRAYYVNNNPNTTWRQYLLFNLRHEFGLMTNQDVKYLPLVARLAYSDDVRFDLTDDNTEAVNLLKKIVRKIKTDDALFQELKQNESITVSQLAERFKEEFEKEDIKDAEEANKVVRSDKYEILEVTDFETAKYYGNHSCSTSKLCYTQNIGTWNNYTKNGINRVYVCLRKGWENIPEKPTEDNPYDLYGTSMIFAFISPKGDLVTSNCRWNHKNLGPYEGDVDHAFTKTTLAQTVGVPFDEVFKAKDFSIDEKELIQMIERGAKVLPSIVSGDFVIPEGTRKIGNYAFLDCKDLKSVIIPDSVTEIGSSAFQNCEGLTSVTIGNSVKYINNSAFYECKSLTSITIPDSVRQIGSYAFLSCTGLTSLTIGNSVIVIGERAFNDCVNLASVTFPSSVRRISEGAFSRCKSLKSVTIPASVSEIGFIAFYNCKELESIVVEEGNPNYDSRDNCNALIETQTNTLMRGCNNTVIPNSVTHIERYAFVGSELESVVIPDSVTSMEESVFANCGKLKSVVISNNLKAISPYTFDCCRALESVIIPNSVEHIRESAFNNCSGMTSLTIGNSVKTIDGSAFAGCKGLTSLEIPDSVEIIDNSAFYDCSGLKSVTLGKSLMLIVNYAFGKCTSLTSVFVSNPLIRLDYWGFEGCENLTLYVNDQSLYKRLTALGYYVEVIQDKPVQTENRHRGIMMEALEELLLEADDRLKRVSKMLDVKFNGIRPLDEPVPDRAHYVNNNPNTTWRQYLLFNLRHEFGLMTNQDVKYLPLVARLAYSDDVRFDMADDDDNTEAVNLLKKIVRKIKSDDALFQELKQNDTITVRELAERFREEFEEEDRKDAEEANKVVRSDNYEILEVTDFETAKYYGDRSCSSSKLCYTQSETTWNNYTKDGLNRVYVCLRKGWEDIPEKPTEDNPYDLYGTSMIFAFISPNGDLTTSNCRWNHKNIGPYEGDVDHAFTKTTLAQTVGVPFDEVFKPHNIDEETMLARMIESGDTGLANLVSGDFVIPEGTRKIGYSAFSYFVNLTSVVIPDSVTEIGHWAFYDCVNLTSVTIPDSVTSIGEHAFEGCRKLKSVVIPDSVKTINTKAFFNCEALTSLKIGNSVEWICGKAFGNCISLTSVVIPDSVETIGIGAFDYCIKLSTVTIGDSVRIIYDEAFEYCRSLTSVTLGNGLKIISYRAFYGCSSLNSIILPDSVTDIGYNAFRVDPTMTIYVSSEKQYRKFKKYFNVSKIQDKPVQTENRHRGIMMKALEELLRDKN